MLAAFLWGAAESVSFFVVADVLLTFIALRCGLRTAAAASVAAALGALCGGAYLWSLAASDGTAAIGLLRSVPFVSQALIERGMAVMAAPNWPLGMLEGSFTGIPYKIFAVGAGQEPIPLVWFLLASLPIRLVRFLLASAVVASLDRLIGRRIRPSGKMLLLAAFWLVFYGQFWLRMTMRAG